MKNKTKFEELDYSDVKDNKIRGTIVMTNKIKLKEL